MLILVFKSYILNIIFLIPCHFLQCIFTLINMLYHLPYTKKVIVKISNVEPLLQVEKKFPIETE